ncbi:MAG: flagellar basal body rod C-terminal domain-containing protein, partial [Oscillospiraceae bacterium]
NVNGINNAQLPRGSGTRMVMADTDFAQGPTMTTGMAQDYAIEGDGFFALVDPATNDISYTRDGSFTLSQCHILDEEGQRKTVYRLSDGQGRFVLSREGGLIDVADGAAEQPVGVFDFVNVDGMQHVGGNRFVPVEKNGQVRMGSGKVQRGVLEASNTDLAYEMSKIIEAQRSFSYALKMVQTSDEVETTINNLRT